MAKYLHSQVTPSAGVFGLPKHEKRGLIRFTTLSSQKYVEPWSPPFSRLGPGTDLAPSNPPAYRDKESGASASMARQCGTLRGSSASPLRRGAVGEGKTGHRQRHQPAGGETPPRRGRRALDAVEQRSLASFATTTLSASSPPSGARADFLKSIRPSWSGRDDTTAVGAPVT
ncbi:hypothetical protein GWK47_055164 [Chionoecetes opilio]|uniref:Uncharacterized protein n=1 Tax=Chionoecetes opilio TaxID=41210 RepID=A0A8J4Y924_CHIOP|nr:hypothetical protein GWK47_055164 [Chionoecetes opilio]